ncbi:hypothetical protein K0B03_03560 [Patescibacteria group bacterium]|nr:hypothetical protein [Patescibacteria group bacterium]
MIKNNNKSNKVDSKRVIFDMIEEISERPRNIIVKRFNLDGNGVITLDQIGKSYGITRERVRQIETEAIAKLKKVGKKHDIDYIFEYIKIKIESRGGIVSEEKLVDILFDGDDSENNNKHISLLIFSLDDRIKVAKESKAYKKIYYFEKESLDKFIDIIERLESHLLESKSNITFETMKHILHNYGHSDITKDYLKSYLDSNKVILDNILGEWGHIQWSHIKPRSVRDKAYLTLKKNQKPLHFIEITKKINEIWNKKKANNQTIHNELIKDDRFVLVGRGIYALSEWGYKPGTVLDVLLEIFNESDKKEMSQDEIIERVLEKRKVKNNTIILNLQNKTFFEKLPGKIYRLQPKIL